MKEITFPLAEDPSTHQTRKRADLPWEAPTFKATWPFITWSTWSHVTIWKKNIFISTKLMALIWVELGTELREGVQHASTAKSLLNSCLSFNQREDKIRYMKHLQFISPHKLLVKCICDSLKASSLAGSSPAASYVQRWALCSNRPANV